jgi:hypothetical protein
MSSLVPCRSSMLLVPLSYVARKYTLLFTSYYLGTTLDFVFTLVEPV